MKTNLLRGLFVILSQALPTDTLSVFTQKSFSLRLSFN